MSGLLGRTETRPIRTAATVVGVIGVLFLLAPTISRFMGSEPAFDLSTYLTGILALCAGDGFRKVAHALECVRQDLGGHP